MKRRSFLESMTIGIAAATAGIVQGCSTSSDKKGKSSLKKSEIPGYWTKIKSSFSTSSQQSANDRVTQALIGAGGWGTGLAINLMDINKNVAIKYICDVDDTRGGRAISEVEKKQGYPPIRVRDSVKFSTIKKWMV